MDLTLIIYCFAGSRSPQLKALAGYGKVDKPIRVTQCAT